MSKREDQINRAREQVAKRIAGEALPSVLPTGQTRSDYIREKVEKAARVVDRELK